MSWMTTFRWAGAACLATSAVLAAAPSATAATCGDEGLFGRGDIDGDRSSDVVVGVPNVGEGSGAVDVRGTNTPWQRLTSGSLGGSQDDNDQVGTAIAVGDLDGDGCADLVVGAPGEGSGKPGEGSGQVHIAFGSPSGIDTASAFVIPTSADPFDRFGAALALEARGNGHDLYVGAPEASVKGQSAAGEVYRYTITPGGARRVTVTAREVRSQNSPGVPGNAETADRFGSVLASVDNGLGVLVGVPDEDSGRLKDVGAVYHLRVNAAGKPIASQSWWQNAPAVAGTAQTGDRFGESVSSRGSVAAIGTPGEDVSGRKNSGQVQTLRMKPNGAFTPARTITQAGPGVPGNVQAGDRFGAQVGVGVNLICQEFTDLAIGSPGEDVGRQRDAGTITLLTETGSDLCRPRLLRQGSGLAGAAETGDQVGSVLTITRGRTDLDEDYADRLLVGVPYEDIGAQADAGLVQPVRGGITVNGKLVPTLQHPEGYLHGEYYGWELGTGSD